MANDQSQRKQQGVLGGGVYQKSFWGYALLWQGWGWGEAWKRL